jgi:hypothetical protein
MRIIPGRITLMLACALVFALSVGCSKADSSDESGYEIIDQPLQGVIEGHSFSLVSGYAEDSYFSPGVEYDLYFYNIAPATTNPWDIGAYTGSTYQEVMFSIPQATGTYQLDLSTRTVTLYNKETSMNIICDLGSIRIDSISGGRITGALAATQTGDDSSYVNGNFDVAIAP